MTPAMSLILQGFVVFLAAVSISGTLFLLAFPIALVLLLSIIFGVIITTIRQALLHFGFLTAQTPVHSLILSSQRSNPHKEVRVRRQLTPRPAGHSGPRTQEHTHPRFDLIKPMSARRKTTIWLHHTQPHQRRTHHAG
jgi:hypothetical protein